LVFFLSPQMTTVNETLVEFPIEPKTQSGSVVSHDQLILKVDGPQRVESKVLVKGSSYFVSFITTITGTYKISITYNGENIVRTPVTVNVKAKDPSEETDLPDTPIDEPPTKHTVRFQVDAKDKNGKPIIGNNYTAEVSGPEEIDGIEIQALDGKLLISFDTFVTSGDFSVSIKYNGEHIDRSPYTVTLSKPEDGERGKSDEIATLEPEDESRTIQFKVDAKLSNGTVVSASELTVSVDSGPDSTWEPRVNDEDGQLLVSFKTRTLGNYTVSVLKDTTHIHGSPFNLQM